MKKRAQITIGVNTIIIVIIAVAVLALLLSFMKGAFSSAQRKLTEKISEEQNPPMPTADYPITVSRENIKTSGGEIEAVKISVFNPTSDEWNSRNTLYQNEGYDYCGESDSVCYVSSGCTQSDIDCNGDITRECDTDGVCLINTATCPEGAPEEIDDCAPSAAGISAQVTCDNKLSINSISLPKTIAPGTYSTFTSVIEVQPKLKGRYLCSIQLLGEDVEPIQKDITIEVV